MFNFRTPWHIFWQKDTCTFKHTNMQNYLTCHVSTCQSKVPFLCTNASWYGAGTASCFKPKDPKTLVTHFIIYNIIVVIVQSPSRVWLFVTPWTAVYQATLQYKVMCKWIKKAFAIFLVVKNFDISTVKKSSATYYLLFLHKYITVIWPFLSQVAFNINLTP